jgi:hypothetical protein
MQNGVSGPKLYSMGLNRTSIYFGIIFRPYSGYGLLEGEMFHRPFKVHGVGQ